MIGGGDFAVSMLLELNARITVESQKL